MFSLENIHSIKFEKYMYWIKRHTKLMILMQFKLLLTPKSVSYGPAHAQSTENIARNQNMFSLKNIHSIKFEKYM